MPSGVRTVDDDMGVIEQPGDVLFFMDGAQTTAPCCGTPITTAAPCSTNTLAAPRPEAAGLRAWPLPRSTGGEELVEGMPPQERGIMYGPASAPGTRDVNLIVDDSGHVTVGEKNA